jgi:hypothetical protein
MSKRLFSFAGTTALLLARLAAAQGQTQIDLHQLISIAQSGVQLQTDGGGSTGGNPGGTGAGTTGGNPGSPSSDGGDSGGDGGAL